MYDHMGDGAGAEAAGAALQARPYSLIDWATMNPIARMFIEWLTAALSFVVDLILVPMLAATKYAEGKAQTLFILWYGPNILVGFAQCLAAIVFVAIQIRAAVLRSRKGRQDAAIAAVAEKEEEQE